MTDIEFAKFVLKDTCKTCLQALSIYAVALVAYWTLV